MAEKTDDSSTGYELATLCDAGKNTLQNELNEAVMKMSIVNLP